MIKLSEPASALFEEIQKLPVIDSHEHLPTEKERIEQTIDATTLFSHYCVADLIAAGISEATVQFVFDTSQPLHDRWKKLIPFFEAIRFGSHAYPAFAYVEQVLGIDNINEATIDQITQRLQGDNKPGVYKKLIQDLCGIETCIQCNWEVIEGDQPFFTYLCGDRSTYINIEQFEKETDRSIYTLSDYVTALHLYMESQKNKGAVGMKTTMAYERTLEVADVSHSTAENVFTQLRASVAPSVSTGERRLLQDYLLRRGIEACIDVDLPVVIHTGYQGGNRNDIRNARALLLWPLLNSYPNARFDLFHGSFPYVSDMTALGKYFPNVTIDMCYMHIVGPEGSRRALREWLDAVPVTKIIAFGADYSVPEKIFGHLQLAQANVAIVLAERIEENRMTEEQAIGVARLMFYDNAKRWYKL